MLLITYTENHCFFTQVGYNNYYHLYFKLHVIHNPEYVMSCKKKSQIVIITPLNVKKKLVQRLKNNKKKKKHLCKQSIATYVDNGCTDSTSPSYNT